jgi:hypothetical protein
VKFNFRGGDPNNWHDITLNWWDLLLLAIGRTLHGNNVRINPPREHPRFRRGVSIPVRVDGISEVDEKPPAIIGGVSAGLLRI